MPIIDDILAGTSGYLEGRAIADVRSIRNIEQMQLRVMWEQLPEEAKQKIIAEQQAQARLANQRRMAFWGGGLIGIVCLFGLVAASTPSKTPEEVARQKQTFLNQKCDSRNRTVRSGYDYPVQGKVLSSGSTVCSFDGGRTWEALRPDPLGGPT